MKMSIAMTDASAPANQAIASMYGGGLNVQLAVTNNLLAYALAPDPTAKIHELVDQIESGSPGQDPTEMQTGMQLIPGADKADFFGTFNVLRFVQMVVAFLLLPLPQMDLPTQSNVAIAGEIGAGKLQIEVAVPKQHVLEAMMTIMKVQQQRMKPADE